MSSDDSFDLADYFEFETRGDKELLKTPIQSIGSLVPLKTASLRAELREKTHKRHKESEYSKFCVFCAEKHGTVCPKYVCEGCFQVGHTNSECPHILENPASPKGASLLEKYESTTENLKEEFKEIVCMACGKRGHVLCKEYTDEVERIPWTPLEGLEKLKQRHESEEEIDSDQPLNLIFEAVRNKKVHFDTLDDGILKRNESRYMDRLDQSKISQCCCKCGGEHRSETCKVEPAHITPCNEEYDTNWESFGDGLLFNN